MRREQIEAWYKDDAFKLWDTADAKPPKYQIKCITWLEMSKLEEIFTRQICQKFPPVCSKENKVTKGCKTWNRYYLLRHDDIKNKVEI